MTTAADHEQHSATNGGRPSEDKATHGLTLLSAPLTLRGAADGGQAGLCVGGVCALPGTHD